MTLTRTTKLQPRQISCGDTQINFKLLPVESEGPNPGFAYNNGVATLSYIYTNDSTESINLSELQVLSYPYSFLNVAPFNPEASTTIASNEMLIIAVQQTGLTAQPSRILNTMVVFQLNASATLTQISCPNSVNIEAD